MNSRNYRTTLLQRLCMVLLFAVIGLGLSSCGDDSTGPPAPTGSSTVTMFHANAAYTSNIVVRLDTMTLVPDLPYGGTSTSTVNNGNRTFSIRATDGTQLATASMNLDSTVTPWVIFSGDASTKEAFTARTKKVSATTGEVAIRVINASKNAGNISLRTGSITGAMLATSVAYKSSTEYTTTQTSTAKLVVVKSDATSTSILDIPLTSLQDTKSYTVIIYGSADPAAQAPYKLAAKVVAD